MNSSKWQRDFQPVSEDRFVRPKRVWIDRAFLKKYSLVSGIAIMSISLLWFIFDPSSSEQELPVVSAPPGPYKTKPPVQNSDQETVHHKTIYEKLSAKKPDEKVEQVEHILPEIEEPMAPPPTLPEEMINHLMNEDLTIEDNPVENSVKGIDMSLQPVNRPTDAESSSSIKAFYQETELEEEPLASNISRNASEETVENPMNLTVSGSSVKARKAINATSFQSSSSMTHWVQLASAKSRDAVEREWKRLISLSRLKIFLSHFKPVYGSIDMGQGEGIHHRLRIGPLPFKEAKALCDKLRDQKVGCIIKKNQ